MYQPIVAPPPPDQFPHELDGFERVRSRWEALRGALGEDWTALASRDEDRRAAIETGAIEGLYALDEGVTQTLIREGLDSSAGRELDQQTFDLIAAQQYAIDLVSESMVRDEPVTVSLIKELHQAVTAGQSTYVATDPLGRQVRRELPRGVFKDEENSVLLPDGSTLDFAPPVHVEAEVDQLVRIMADHVDAPWAYRGAIAHHMLTHIHPFADGNGRTARLLTAHQFLRGGLPPPTIETELRGRYLQALHDADGGQLSTFFRFLSYCTAETARRIERQAFSSEVTRHISLDRVAAAFGVMRETQVPVLDAQAACKRFGEEVAERIATGLLRLLSVIRPDPHWQIQLKGLGGRPWQVDAALEDQTHYQVWPSATLWGPIGMLPEMTVGVLLTEGPQSQMGMLIDTGSARHRLPVDLENPDWTVVDRWLEDRFKDYLVQNGDQLFGHPL